MKIKIDLQSIIGAPETYLASAATAGSNTLVSLNTSSFTGGTLVIVGYLGNENAEASAITSVTSNTGFLLSAVLKFDHAINSIIQKMYFDQVIVYKSTDNVSYSTVITSTVTGDLRYFEHEDATGTSATYYKYRFYNTLTTTYSDYSNPFTLALPSVNDTIISSLEREFRTSEDTLIKTADVFESLADVDMYITQEILKTNPAMYKTSTTINIVAGTSEYALPATCLRITRVLVKYNTTDNYRESQRLPEEYGDNSENFSGQYKHSTYRKDSDRLTYINIKNSPTTAVVSGIKVEYVKQPQRIMQMSDSLNTPNALLYSNILKDGIRSILWRNFKDRQDIAGRYEEKFSIGIGKIVQIANDNDLSEGASFISGELGEIYTY